MSISNELRARAAVLRESLPERRGGGPPPENGQRLATLARGPGEELRITWSQYENHPYLGIRLWKQDESGGWWPDKHKGMSIRIRELPELAAAVAECLDLAERHTRSQPQSSRDGVDRGGPRYDPGRLPGMSREDFDEFR